VLGMHEIHEMHYIYRNTIGTSTDNTLHLTLFSQIFSNLVHFPLSNPSCFTDFYRYKQLMGAVDKFAYLIVCGDVLNHTKVPQCIYVRAKYNGDL
jgi:hypothetical protein